jgi:hypothetical protein
LRVVQLLGAAWMTLNRAEHAAGLSPPPPTHCC